MEIAAELDISPWESLLVAVRRSAGRVAWIDAQLSAATLSAERRHAEMLADGDPDAWKYLPGLDENVQKLMVMSRVERQHGANVSQVAINAGVAERIVKQIEMEGQLVGKALMAAFDSMPMLTTEQRAIMLAAAHSQLLAIGAGPPVINGELA